MYEIVDGVWMGDYVAAASLDVIRDYNIGGIIQIGDALCFPYYKTVSGPHYLRISCPDHYTSSMFKHFDNMNEFINDTLDRGECVLIHCLSGLTRAPTAVMAYIVSVYPDVPLSDIYSWIKKRNSSVKIGSKFKKQLRAYRLRKTRGEENYI